MIQPVLYFFFMFQLQEVLLLGPRTECWRSGHHLPHGEIHRNKDIDNKTRNKDIKKTFFSSSFCTIGAQHPFADWLPQNPRHI